MGAAIEGAVLVCVLGNEKCCERWGFEAVRAMPPYAVEGPAPAPTNGVTLFDNVTFMMRLSLPTNSFCGRPQPRPQNICELTDRAAHQAALEQREPRKQNPPKRAAPPALRRARAGLRAATARAPHSRSYPPHKGTGTNSTETRQN